ALSRVTVANVGPTDVTVDAAVTDSQRFTLTLTVDARLSLVPLAPDDPQTPQQCSPARGSRIVCPVQGSLTTGQATLAVTAIYPQQHLPMPQSMTLAGNAAATFTSPDDAAVLAVQRLSAATPLQ